MVLSLLVTSSLASVVLAEELGAPGTPEGAPTVSVHLPKLLLRFTYLSHSPFS